MLSPHATHRRAVPVALVAFVASVALSACGSSASSGPNATKPITRAEYIKREDAICTAFKTQGASVSAAMTAAGNDLKKVATALSSMQPIITSFIARSKQVQRPPGDDKPLDQYFAGLNESASLVKQSVAALKSGQAASITRVGAALDAASKRQRALVQSYGFTVCGPIGAS